MSRSDSTHLHLRLSAEPGAARLARRAVAQMASHLRVLDRADLVVLVSEVITALVETGAESVELEVLPTEGGYRVEARGVLCGGDLDPLAEALLDRLANDWEAQPGRVAFEVRVSGFAEEECPDEELLARAAVGDPSARDALAARYGRLTRSLARRFVRSGVGREDLEQVAALGLLKAMERFDPGREVRFATFAARTIEGELKRHLRDSGWSLRVPRGLQELGIEAARAAAELTQQEGREATVGEVAEALGEGAEEVGQALSAWGSFSAASLDAPAGHELDLRLIDSIPSHDRRLVLAPEWADLSRVIDTLPQRERLILYLRFFEDLHQSEIAERVGVSQMHISRLLARSIGALREMIGLEVPPEG